MRRVENGPRLRHRYGRLHSPYYLDGVAAPCSAISDLTPEELEVVEVYAWPQIPAEFSVGDPCGVVAYWRRRPPGGLKTHATVWSVLVAAIVGGMTLLLR